MLLACAQEAFLLTPAPGADLRSINVILCPGNILHPPRPRVFVMRWVGVSVSVSVSITSRYRSIFLRNSSSDQVVNWPGAREGIRYVKYSCVMYERHVMSAEMFEVFL